MPVMKQDPIDRFIELNGEGGDMREPETTLRVEAMFGRKYHRLFMLTVGDERTVDPMNQQAKRNRGRRCTVLAFFGHPALPSYAVVRFHDTNRIGKVDMRDLPPDPPRAVV